jgi:microcompartment protein CcmK/EutM
MNLARVRGRVTATRRVAELGPSRLVLLEPLSGPDGPPRLLVAADPFIGAGAGALVWYVAGSDAVDALDTPAPIDAAVVGLVDT